MIKIDLKERKKERKRKAKHYDELFKNCNIFTSAKKLIGLHYRHVFKKDITELNYHLQHFKSAADSSRDLLDYARYTYKNCKS